VAGRYFIETWGCQMNVHDAEKIAGAFRVHGYRPADAREEADVILLNTCSIREKAQEKVFDELGRLRELKEARPELVLGVCGCVAQQEGEAIFQRAPHVDVVVGTRATGSLPLLVNRLRSGDESARHACDVAWRDDSIHFPFDQIFRDGIGAGKAFVTIIEGCNHRCTYCVVPQTRGREANRPMDEVLREVEHLAGSGVREVEFLGQTVNAYRDPEGRTLGDLVVAAAAVPGIRRIRFTTSHPAQMTDALIASMAAARPALCPYLHLPVQSGSSRVLAAMRRGYDRERYLDRVSALRAALGGLSLGTDVIVGFPGETEDEFRETLSLLLEVEFDTVYSFAYSPRPGTRAALADDDVPGPEKLRRLAVLQQIQREIQERRMARWVGQVVEVLVEGPDKRRSGAWTGRTPEARIVNFSGPAEPGALVPVLVERSTAFSLGGRTASRAIA
jgi:tRNA-2-methylthio-N6-dimethylallyladenosine synthase